MGKIDTSFESINRAIYLNPYEDSLYRLKPKIRKLQKSSRKYENSIIY